MFSSLYLRPSASQLLKHRFIKQGRKIVESSKVNSISSIFTQRSRTSSASDTFYRESRVIWDLPCTRHIESRENGDFTDELNEIIDNQDLTVSNITWEFQKINLND